MSPESYSGERSENRILKEEIVHRKILSTPTGPDKRKHWFEADYKLITYDNGTQTDFLMPGTLHDLGPTHDN